MFHLMGTQHHTLTVYERITSDILRFSQQRNFSYTLPVTTPARTSLLPGGPKVRCHRRLNQRSVSK